MMSSTKAPPTLTYTNMDLDSLLAQEIEELNKDTPEDRKVREAVILDRPDPNAFNYDSSSSSEDEDDGRGGRLHFLRFKRSHSPHHRGPYYRSYAPGSDDYEDDLAIRDPQLYEITEKNRYIDYQGAKNDDTMEEKKDRSSRRRRPDELVFSDVPVTITKSDQIIVQFDYGVAPEQVTAKKSRKYLMACDFGEESVYAMEWAMGSLLRSGDVIHIVSVIGLEDDLDDMDEDEKYRLWQEIEIQKT
ncbi:hypothetical protein BC941DRAFT_147002 [Chlamydoabsidia padenii]|nr:hypothetical protein BC941DRAFT_147002 [Chlamydoabsidia padenii]